MVPTRFKLTMKNNLMAHNLSKRAIFDCATPIEPLKCSQCADFKTHNLAELKRHFEAGHALLEPEEEKFYYCESCIFRTCSRYLRLMHNLSSLCMKTQEVKSEETIPEESEIADENEIDKNGTTTFQCSYCSSELRSRFSLEQHVKVLHGSGEGGRRTIFACELCPYTTENGRNYNRHVLNKHTQNGRILKCDHCSYETRYTHCLKRHVIMHHTDPEKIQWFNCEHCSYKGKTNSLLRTHVSDHHNGGPVKCDQCPFVTKFKRSLKTHILSKHTEVDKIRWFQCAHCPYKSKSSGTLNSHVSHKHGQMESLKCDHCSFQTKYKNSLKKHVMTQHARLQEMESSNCAHCSCAVKADVHL